MSDAASPPDDPAGVADRMRAQVPWAAPWFGLGVGLLVLAAGLPTSWMFVPGLPAIFLIIAVERRYSSRTGGGVPLRFGHDSDATGLGSLDCAAAGLT